MTLLPSTDVIREIAPGGRMRVALNLANPLLAEGTADDPKGVTVDLSRKLAKALSVDVEFASFNAAGKVVDALKTADCTVAFMAIDSSRAADFIFSPAYMLIEAAYAVRNESNFNRPSDVDTAGVRVISADGAAYTQYLKRILQHAELVLAKDPFDDIASGAGDVVAGIRHPIAKFVKENGFFRMVDERFMEIPQGVAVLQGKNTAAEFLRSFVEEMKSSGVIAKSLVSHGHHDAVVAPSGA